MGFHTIIKIPPFCKKETKPFNGFNLFFLRPLIYKIERLGKKLLKTQPLEMSFYFNDYYYRPCQLEILRIPYNTLIFFFFVLFCSSIHSLEIDAYKSDEKKERKKSSTYSKANTSVPVTENIPTVRIRPPLSVPCRSSLVCIMMTFYFCFFRLHIFSTCGAFLRPGALA